MSKKLKQISDIKKEIESLYNTYYDKIFPPGTLATPADKEVKALCQILSLAKEVMSETEMQDQLDSLQKMVNAGNP